MSRSLVVTALAGAALCLTSLSGCASSDGSTAAAESSAAGSGCPVEATDAWAKAADSGMTAVFGQLRNTGAEEITITSATSEAAGSVEIHEMVDKDGTMMMQPKSGGLAIPAGATAALAPGAEHIMLMDIKEPIKAGDTVTVTVVCSDGSNAKIVAAARTFTGAQEQYSGSASASPAMS